jgi:ABC-type multidrug transport system ATPase subunit
VIKNPRRVRDRIGYMGQKVSLYQGLSIKENVEFYAGLYGLEGKALDERWGALRERLALGDAEGERPENLPAGIRQRAGLALATLHQPRVLFLDEPTAGVDVESRGLFWDRIAEEAERGVTVFVTTHFLEEVEYCDWVSLHRGSASSSRRGARRLRVQTLRGYRVRLALERRCARARRSPSRGGRPRPKPRSGLEITTPTLDATHAAGRSTKALRRRRSTSSQPTMPGVFIAYPHRRRSA